MTQIARYAGRADVIPMRKRGKTENLLVRLYHGIVVGLFLLGVGVMLTWAVVAQLIDFGQQFGAWLFTQPGVGEFWLGWGFLVKWGLSVAPLFVLVFFGAPALNRAYERRRRHRSHR